MLILTTIGSTTIDAASGNIVIGGTTINGTTGAISTTVPISLAGSDFATAADVAAAKSEAIAASTPSSHVGAGGAGAHAVAVPEVFGAGFMSGSDKMKLDGIESGATAYAHPSGDGNLHVPAIGTSNNGKVLTAGSSAGSLSWAEVVGGLKATPVKTSAYTAVVNDLVRVNSTLGSFTVTLPSSPADGDKVGLIDMFNACGNNPVLLAAAGGKSVEFDATGLSVNVVGASVTLMYNADNTNWKKV